MSSAIESLIAQYGLIAVFIGCVAEGETAALLAGFLAHQGTFAPVAAWLAVFLGAFLGDFGFYGAGRLMADSAWVASVRSRPGFSHLLALAQRHPASFVILNRYVYGMRLAGGVASGVARIPAPTFVILNALSSAIWATIFAVAGWVFGLGFESFLKRELLAHERLFIVLAIAAVSLVIGFLLWRRRRSAGQ